MHYRTLLKEALGGHQQDILEIAPGETIVTHTKRTIAAPPYSGMGYITEHELEITLQDGTYLKKTVLASTCRGCSHEFKLETLKHGICTRCNVFKWGIRCIVGLVFMVVLGMLFYALIKLIVAGLICAGVIYAWVNHKPEPEPQIGQRR